MAKFKIGDRVQLNDSTLLGVMEGGQGTVMNISHDRQDRWYFVNTDKLNDYNHDDFNGNGLNLLESSLTLVEQLNTVLTGSWSKEDVDYLHSYYRRKSVTEIAEHLKRSYYSVQSKARSEGIHKHPRREYNANDNHFIIHSHVDNMAQSVMANNLHRSKSSIGSRINLMNERKMIPTLNNK